MSHMNFIFPSRVLQKLEERPDRRKISMADIQETLLRPDEVLQERKNNNYSSWKYLKSKDKVLRVVIQDDGQTIVTAYYDRDYLKRYKRSL